MPPAELIWRPEFLWTLKESETNSLIVNLICDSGCSVVLAERKVKCEEFTIYIMQLDAYHMPSFKGILSEGKQL